VGRCLGHKVGDDDCKHAAVLAAACTPHSSGIHGLEFFFVTSQALSCGAIYFAEACGKSVTVGSNVGRVLRCRGCSHAHLVRKGGQVIRSHYVEDGTADDAPEIAPGRVVDDSYYAPPQAQRLGRVRKRKLTPRVPATEAV